jgi:heme peroxidase
MRHCHLAIASLIGATAIVSVAGTTPSQAQERRMEAVRTGLSCAKFLIAGEEDVVRPVAAKRYMRFEGKLDDEARERCRGGEMTAAQAGTPWVDWSNYFATGGPRSRSGLPVRDGIALTSALIDLEYQRMELIKFNLFDNKTFEQYGSTPDGPVLKTWKEMRLPAGHPNFEQVGGNGAQRCNGDLIRHRTLTGICNDIDNPAMGSSGQLFARNVEFESTYPDLRQNELAKNRHGDRLGLLKPDPQVISRRLFTRDQKDARNCNQGHGASDSVDADCPYKKAPFFNVLAAFWIQFMTHDWFSHMEDARNNQSQIMSSLGCAGPGTAAQLGCRPEDKMEAALIADSTAPGTFKAKDEGEGDRDRITRSYKTTSNNVTAWWDASQLYGHDERSQRRAKRDPADPAKFEMKPVRTGETLGYLPVFGTMCPPGTETGQCDPIRPEWAGQEATGFPDNWSIGMSFYHNLFVREHNTFVDEFRKKARQAPNEDSGLRNPANPRQVITNSQVSSEELFQIARLVVSAEIAKIHTIEWTTQLLYNEPLYRAMNSNWSGLLDEDKHPLMMEVAERVLKKVRASDDPKKANVIASAISSGPGIIGLGSKVELLDEKGSWKLDVVNGGTQHFGSPFNFPEEFPTVYRLHPLVPDLIEFRQIDNDPNVIRKKIAVVDTFRGKATGRMHEGGLGNWALSMGRQRLGMLLLQNHPQFLQNLDLPPRLDTKIDVPALDVIRDRERGLPRFNELRRQIGLRQLTKFEDFIDQRPNVTPQERADQEQLVKILREIYGQHTCDEKKIITSAQRNPDGTEINDCLGKKHGEMVDNIEDVDIVVGWLAETTRPHGFAISETQFHLFILNASRRLFSDRFFTSSFRPEFYSTFGINWVNNNGPNVEKMFEPREVNGHQYEVAPLKRVLLRNTPELEPELRHVVNTFDPWARDRGTYYSLDWKARADAKSDPAFPQ